MDNYVRQKQTTYKFDFDKDGEKNSGEVLTIQNDSYTIRELLEKFTKGVFQPSQIMRSGELLDFEDGIMDSENTEFIDRTDVSKFLENVNLKKKAVAKLAQSKAQATRTTTKEEDKEQKAEGGQV